MTVGNSFQEDHSFVQLRRYLFLHLITALEKFSPFSKEAIVSKSNIWILLSLLSYIQGLVEQSNSSWSQWKFKPASGRMCFKYLGRVECYVVLWFECMKIFGRYLHHEGGDQQKSYFEVFSRAGSDWPLCKISNLAFTPFMFFVYKYHIFEKCLTKIFSLNIWTVFHLSQTASDGFD